MHSWAATVDFRNFERKRNDLLRKRRAAQRHQNGLERPGFTPHG